MKFIPCAVTLSALAFSAYAKSVPAVQDPHNIIVNGKK